MTAPSNANTSGLIAEIDAEMEGRQRGYADVRGELLFRCRDALVTAASAQARIAELEAENESHRSGGWILAETRRRQEAEARADRLAKALVMIGGERSEQKRTYPNSYRGGFDAATDLAASIARAALQQETQP